MTNIYKDRRFKESPWEQSIQEDRVYTVTVPTTWGTATFTSLSCALFEDPNGDNTTRTSTMLTGSTTASGQVITTQKVTGLTVSFDYRLEVLFTTSEGDDLVAWGIIKATR